MSPFQAVDSVTPWIWGLWKAGTWSFLTAMLTLSSSTTSMTRWTWLEKRWSSAQVGSLPPVPSQPLSLQHDRPQPLQCVQPLSSGQHQGQLLPPQETPPRWGCLPALPVSPTFPTSPLPRSFLLHSRGFSPQNLTWTPSTANSSAGCCVT